MMIGNAGRRSVFSVRKCHENPLFLYDFCGVFGFFPGSLEVRRSLFSVTSWVRLCKIAFSGEVNSEETLNGCVELVDLEAGSVFIWRIVA
jgi:hypothetical protein